VDREGGRRDRRALARRLEAQRGLGLDRRTRRPRGLAPRGLGEALLRQSFREFWRRGEHRVALRVDAEHPTGAPRLYERLGMRPLWKAVLNRQRLRRSPAL
jgi:ribosomal protein S18 acetylase RimI-like enzyme